MNDQNKEKEWKERWEQQIAKWRQEIDGLLDQAEALLALIELAKTLIRRDPPE